MKVNKYLGVRVCLKVVRMVKNGDDWYRLKMINLI